MKLVVKDRVSYLSRHDSIDGDKLALCEYVFSSCSFTKCKYTIIIPEYRRPITAKEAVLSALNQDYAAEYEVLLTSDGKFPEELETERILRELSKSHNNISYYRNSTNVGMFNNWNNCISNAKGDWIVVLPDDDLLSPFFLSTIDEFISKTNYIGMLGSRPHKVFGKEKYDATSFEKAQGKLEAKWIDNYGVFFDDGISVTGMTFDKQSILEFGGFQNVFYPVSDSVCMINYAIKKNLVRLNCDISAYRIDENVSQSNGVLEKILLYAARMKETVSETDKMLSVFYRYFRAELMHDYILGAERAWDTEVNKDNVDPDVKIGYEYSSTKYRIMKILRRIIRKLHYTKRVKFYLP